MTVGCSGGNITVKWGFLHTNDVNLDRAGLHHKMTSYNALMAAKAVHVYMAPWG